LPSTAVDCRRLPSIAMPSALIVYSGHLRGACKTQKLLVHFATMCARVFDRCDAVMVTYDHPYGRSISGLQKKENREGLSTVGCLNLIRTQIRLHSVLVTQEVFSTFPVDIYYQLVSNIHLSAMLANKTIGSYAAVLRLRPDAGLGVNALMSLKTWQTLKSIPNRTIVQYGTWKTKDGVAVNGDNAFAAHPQTFVRFVLAWKDTLRTMDASALPAHMESTMQLAGKWHNFQLATPKLR
jgi:hypothetical protein